MSDAVPEGFAQPSFPRPTHAPEGRRMIEIPVQPSFFGRSSSAPTSRNATTFVDNMQLPVHRWFRYSAGFSAEWVEQVVKEAGAAQSVRVLDPFAGSATTLLAAQFTGAQSLGVDSHPFVARVARAKLHWTEDHRELLDRARSTLGATAPAELPDDVPKLLTTCYEPDVLRDLLGLRDALQAGRVGDPIDDLLWLAFVAIVRPVSHVGTAQWQYVLPNKRKRTTPRVVDAFERQLSIMASDMAWRQVECPAPPTAEFREVDVRFADSLPDAWATHIICSPPYANNYDYADATRLEQTVLGEVRGWGDLKATRRTLLRSCSQHMVRYDPEEAFSDPLLRPILDELRGVYARLDEARAQYGGKKAYHHMIVAYFHDLARVWKVLRRASASGVQVCFVVGDSAPYGVHVPVERWLGELAIGAGFSSWRFEKVRDRNTKWKNRKHRVPLHEGQLLIEG